MFICTSVQFHLSTIIKLQFVTDPLKVTNYIFLFHLPMCYLYSIRYLKTAPCPRYSVHGEWECKRHRVFLPFGQQKEPYDKVPGSRTVEQ